MNQINKRPVLYQSIKILVQCQSRKDRSYHDLTYSVKRALWSTAKVHLDRRNTLKCFKNGGHCRFLSSADNSDGESPNSETADGILETGNMECHEDGCRDDVEAVSKQSDSESLSVKETTNVAKKNKTNKGSPDIDMSQPVDDKSLPVTNGEDESQNSDPENKSTRGKMTNLSKYHKIQTTIMNPSSLTKELVLEFINQHSMKHEVGHTSLITTCPRLGKRAKLAEEKNRLYINSITGSFLCQHCKKFGEWDELKDNISIMAAKKTKRNSVECFANSLSVQKVYSHSEYLNSLLESSIPVQNLTEEQFALMVHFHNCTRIRKDIFMKYRIRYNPFTREMHLPYVTPTQEVVGVKVIKATPRDPEEVEDGEISLTSTYLPRNIFWVLFGWSNDGDFPVSHETVVLTSSEMDAIAITQVTGICGLALPKDSLELPIAVLPSLEHCKKIIIWLGNSKTSWEAALRFAKKLGEKRCFVLKPGILGEVSRVVDALERNVNLKKILFSAVPIANESITNFTNLRDEVYFEFLHMEQSSGTKWLRFPTLTKVLKGFRPGELTIFTGPTGSGKTTFLSEYSLDLCMQGVNTLWGSFEINNVRLAKMMLMQYAMKNLHKHLNEYEEYAYKFENLPMHFLKFHGQENITKVIKTITHAVYIHDIRHIIIDNLQFMMGSSMDTASDKFARQDMIIGAFRRFSTEYDCHVTIIIHPRKEKEGEDLTNASIFGSAKATQEADNVLILQEKKVHGTRHRRFIQVTKNRFDGDLGMMLLKFNKESLTYSGHSDSKAKSKTVTTNTSSQESVDEESDDRSKEEYEKEKTEESEERKTDSYFWAGKI